MALLAGFRRCTRWGKPVLSGCTGCSAPRVRPISCSSRNFLNVSIDESSGIATLTLHRKPANTLSMEYMTDMSIALDKLDHDKSCKGLIITSGLDAIFSGGLELSELYQPSPARLREVWRMLQEIWIRIYGSRLAVIAAINGHAFAGGCLLSLACDYRVMAEGDGRIGFTGSKMGILLPPWLLTMAVDTMGQRNTECCVGSARTYAPAKALSIGLVDKVVPPNDLMPTALQVLTELLQIPDYARHLSKEKMRRPLLQGLLAARESDTDAMVACLLSKAVQQNIKAHMDALNISPKDHKE